VGARFWAAPMLGAVVVLAIFGIVLLARSWPRKPALSTEERADIADTPMPSLQKRAWWGFVIGVVTFGGLTAILVTRGAVAYWEDDNFRLSVVAFFIIGLVAQAAVTTFPYISEEARRRLDERDRAVLGRAATAQTALIVLGLAAWLVILGQRFHDQGAVPMVYLYLIFGSVILLMMIGQSLGILLGYWIGVPDGEG